MDSQKLKALHLGMPEKAGLAAATAPAQGLSPFELEIAQIVHQRWPTSALEIAEFLGHTIATREHKRTLSSRLSYHLKKLVHKQVLMSKRIGNALMVWPYEVEKFRLMHELFPHSPRPAEPSPTESQARPPEGVH
ncbi:MAG: hypothetical protein IPJ89_05205 [Candidatus Iainarchaeum archaeon]|uniref:Uncharacterized protein n=1 Tax=Candidatus Iainarchaeum sp. TaxID=3101447 RepID=A0A7T9DJK9_9ARCH|nr:MAG: hypothetical protein IPJ89_05205 [Candidatus Diapherotrites archaeon]